jgi:hypothetical protein
MTNIAYIPIIIYSYHDTDASPNGIATGTAARRALAAATSTTPIWRNILIRHVTATIAAGGECGFRRRGGRVRPLQLPAMV